MFFKMDMLMEIFLNKKRYGKSIAFINSAKNRGGIVHKYNIQVKVQVPALQSTSLQVPLQI